MKASYTAIFLLLATGILTCQQLVAQEYSYTYYNASNGLSSSEITAIAKDSKGFLWIGTAAGLSYYDGYTFTNYQYTEDNYLLGTINVIKPAGQDTIWIGAGSGLYCMIHGKLIKVNVDINTSQGVNDIVVTSNGSLWLATEQGPAFVPATEIKIHLRQKINLLQWVLKNWKPAGKSIDSRRATAIAEAPDGTIYLAQDEFLYQVMPGEIKLIFSSAYKNDIVQSIFPISKSKVFFDCAATEMNKVEDGKWSYVYYGRSYLTPGAASKNSFWYVGTVGLFCFNPEDETVSSLINTLDKQVYWPSGFVKDGTVFWLASHDGLIKLKPALFNRFEDIQYDNVKETYSLLKLNNGDLILGSNRGKLWKKQQNNFINFLPGNQTMVSRAELKALFQDERGWLWAGTGYQGLALYRDGKISLFTKEKDGLHDNTIQYIFKGSAGKLYAVGDQGMSELVVSDDNKITIHPYYFDPRISKHAQFSTAIESPGKTIWIGGQEGLFYLENNAWHGFRLVNKTVQVNDIRQTKDGILWIATSGEGLFECRFKNDTAIEVIKQYKENDGIHTALFLNLLVDYNENIWAASAKGLTFIGRNGAQKGRLLNFDAADGFIKNGYNNIKLCQENDSTIWAATTQGITSFNPKQLIAAHNQPSVFITGIHLLKNDGKNVRADSVSNNSFSYNNNSFSFSFTAVDYANQESVQYYYKLDGADTSWQFAGTARNATFSNLNPGKYTFIVKALNDKGLWSKQSATYSFIITNPFWQEWWFTPLAVLLVGLVVIALIRRSENIAARKEAQKTAVEKLRAASYRYQLEIEQVINYFATSINQQYTVDNMLWDVARNCISKLGFEDCVIYLLDTNRNILIQKAAWGPKTDQENKIVDPIEIPLGKGIVGTVALSGTAEIINDTSIDERYIIDDANRLSEITVPIISNNNVLGIIDSEHSRKHFYTDRHLHILTTIASLLADKIEKLIAAQQAREKEIELLKLNKDLATWQITALRSQMNPHFIFNAMNSIQQFTLSNDSDNANRYISKFSTLLRKVLYSSQENYISLEEETEQLGLYLDIEKLRMGDSFRYSISIDDAIEADAIKIPGMLVQPFVENAVKHGLPLKEGEKTISVRFTMNDEFHLHVIITDNGIGRTRSEALKAEQKLLPNVSRGIQLVRERLELLQQDKSRQAAIQIDDLSNQGGTMVTLIIPVL